MDASKDKGKPTCVVVVKKIDGLRVCGTRLAPTPGGSYFCPRCSLLYLFPPGKGPSG